MPGVPNVMAALKRGMSAGVLYGGYPYARSQWLVANGEIPAPNFGSRVNSITDLIAIMEPGDVAMVGPGFYDEGDIVIPEGLNNITLIGAGGRGCAGLEPSGAAITGLQVLADDVTLINFGVAGDDTAAFALKIGSQEISPARFRAYGCKFEGVDTVNPGAAVVLQGTGDTIFEDCEFAWCANAMLFQANSNGFVTQTLLKNNRFHNYATVGLGVVVAGEVRDLWVVDNVFGRAEDGTAGTDDILLSDNANTGFITGNRFPRATNGTGFITIGTGLIYNPNGTEAGWSTARPA